MTELLFIGVALLVVAAWCVFLWAHYEYRTPEEQRLAEVLRKRTREDLVRAANDD
jgi:hypothetical protein